MGLIVLLYLFLFFIYIFCFTLFYFIYCKISNLYFYFCFVIFARKSQLSIDLSRRHVHSKRLKKKNKRFWEGRDQLGCVHMEVKDSLKAREMYSDFRKRKRKGRKEGRIFLFQWRGSLEARRYKKEREKIRM